MAEEIAATETPSPNSSPESTDQPSATEQVIPVVDASEGVEVETDWGAVATQEDEELDVPAKEVLQPDTTTPATEETTPAAKVTPAPGSEVAPAAATTTETPTTPSPAAEAPKAPAPPTAEQLEARKKASEEADKVNTAKLVELYKLTDEEASQVQTDPEAVLPQFAARIHKAVLTSLVHSMGQILPHQIRAVSTQVTNENSMREEFFGRWPELKGHDKQVLEAGEIFRRLNGTATKAEAIERIGAIVLAGMGKTVAPPSATTTTPAATPKTPAKTGFRPAGATGAKPAAPAVDNEWAELANEFAASDNM